MQRFIVKYNESRGTWGTWDQREREFAGSTGSEAGAKVQKSRMNRELYYMYEPTDGKQNYSRYNFGYTEGEVTLIPFGEFETFTNRDGSKLLLEWWADGDMYFIWSQ